MLLIGTRVRWVERGYYADENEAEADLARNNPQVILTQEEMRKVIKSVIGDFLEECPRSEKEDSN